MIHEFLHTLLFRIKKVFRLPRIEREMEDELSFHLDALTEQNLERGMTPRDARLAAVRSLGSGAQIREAYRDQMTFPTLEAVIQDTRYAFRALRKAPGFTLTAVAVLGLGIGVNAGLFSIVSALCFRPLPLPGADRLHSVTGYTSHAAQRRKLSYPTFSSIREQGKGYIDLAAYDSYNSVQAGSSIGAPAEIIRAALVSDNFFAVLNARPRFGSTFVPGATAEGITPQSAYRTVVLSHRLWLRRFGADTIPIGASIRLNQQLFTVIGVMPPEFQGPDIMLPDVWIRLKDQPVLQPERTLLRDEDARWLILIGRLSPNANRTQAQSALSAMIARMPVGRPGEESIKTVSLEPAVIFPINSEMAPFLILLMLPTGLVLLIACANLANLLLARSALRGKEITTRLALGATRRRLIQQLMTESALLALLGGLAGTLVASQVLQAGSQYLREFTAGLGLVDPVFSLDAGVWGFMLAVSLVASLASGLTPALYASRQDLASAAKQDGGSFSGGARGARLRNALMIAQVAVCTVLLTAAGLMIRSFQKSLVADPGFATEDVVALQFNLGAAGYSKARAEAFHRQLRGRLHALPHVRSIAEAAAMPLSDRPAAPLLIAGPNGTGDRYRLTSPFNEVSPDFFRVLGIPLVAGRMFTPGEMSADAPVALISQATAQRLWPGESPLGRRFRVQSDLISPLREVIGVVADTRSVWLSRVDESYFYVPFDPAGREQAAILVRLDRDLPGSRSELSETIRAIDSTLPVRMQPMRDVLNQWRLLPLAGSALATCLALVALGLAGVGMYGVMGYLVSQRKREFGIRIAMGARKLDILSMVFRQGFRVVLTGLGMGLAGAAALARLLMGSFYGLSAYDPPAFLFVVFFVGLAAMAAMYGPARRAIQVDPTVSLRSE